MAVPTATGRWRLARRLGFMNTGARRAARAVRPDLNAPVDRHSVNLMKQVLTELSEKDRDVLTRFYLLNQTQQQICEELNVTEIYSRLLKSRAKARFNELRLENPGTQVHETKPC